jgi:hypothetical protein
MYTTETNIYSKLRLGADSAIVKTYAGFSFPESQRCIAVLEYANGGSLIEFFRSKSPPLSNDNIVLLWEKLMKLTEAIDMIHKWSKRSSGWTPNDMRPENILVFSKDKNCSISAIDFKFEGCSLVELGGPPTPDEEIAMKENGSRMYLPPESSTCLPPMHSPETDIWSLGAVFSDCLVWSISGEAGRERYFNRRMIELIDHNPCYHDGVKRLRVVDECHELALLHKNDDDLMTIFMSRIILFKMLAPAGERWTALQITESFQTEIRQLRLPLPSISTVSQPDSPDSVAVDLGLASQLSLRMDLCVRHFRDYVKGKSIHGLDGEGQAVSYIPPCALETYWTEQRMNFVLTSPATPIDATYEAIGSRYLRIFSILTFIGHCHKIPVIYSNDKGLDDDNLPFTADDFEPESKWSNEFLESQWMFCPFIFSHNRDYKRALLSRTILPVTYGEYISERRSGPDAAVLRKVRIHDQCNFAVRKVMKTVSINFS